MPHGHVARRHSSGGLKRRHSYAAVAGAAYRTGGHVGRFIKSHWKSQHQAHNHSGGDTSGKGFEADYFTPSAGGKYATVFYKVPALKHHLRRLQKETYTKNDFTGGRAIGPLGRRAYTSMFNPSAQNLIDVANLAALASGGATGLKNYSNTNYLKKIRLHAVITNVENVAAEVTVYMLRPIKNHNVPPTTAMATGIQNEGGSATSYLDYDQNPNDSIEFKKAWNIIRRKHVFIMPGETVKYDCTIVVNKPVMSYDTTLTGGNLYDSMYTYHLLLAQQGGAISNDTTTKTNVSSSSSTLNWICRYEYVFATMEPDNVKTFVAPVANLSSTFPVGESIMNEDTAVVATTTSA
jgi:hypothetical protein